MEGHPDMKTNTDDLVVGVVALNGGNFVGRTRLQKTALLLDHCGVNSGVEFEYLHYGPYSSDLAEGWDQARLANRLQMEARTGRYEMPYTVFRTQQPAPERIRQLIRSNGQEFAFPDQRLFRRCGRISSNALVPS